ncbi:MAG: carboxypeptidase regulatory-like domain-containing protein [Candidatus Cloacimonas sp.]|jgi:hypothetical protein|nr:carboxypeptidase regulatory-like domain-containing protein [Candidatus Cloacimonas sp.]
MRKSLLFTLLLILGISLCGNIFAQVTVTLGEGTTTNTTTGDPAPYGTYWKNFRQQYLVRAAELNDAGGGAGNINSIAFNVQALNTCSSMPNYRIRIKATTQTVLTTTFETGTYQQVFQTAEFMPVIGWNTHTFSAPFAWDGNANLLIDIVSDLIPGTYTQNASAFFTTTSYNSSLRFQSDTAVALDALTGTTGLARSNMQFNMQALDITDLNALSITGPTTPNVNSPVNYTVSVKNYSNTTITNYTVKLMKTGGVELASVPGTAINNQQTLQFTLPWTPTVVGETQVYGKVEMTGDQNPANNETTMFTVVVMEAGLLVAEIGTGTTTNTNTGAPAPYGTFYKAFRQQLLYTAADFYAAGAAPGLISALAFNVQDLLTCSPMPNYTIRIKNTTQEALTTTFEAGEYTTVWHSDMFMPTTAWNLHNFTAPFLWDGSSNLLVDITTDLIAGTYTYNAMAFYTPTAYNSSLRFQSDTANGSTGTTGTTAMNRSNIRFFLTVADMGSLNGVVTAGAAPLADAEIVVTGTVFHTTTAANGSYSFPFVPVGAQTVSATKHGYNVVTNNVTIVEDQATTSNFTLALLPQVTVTGKIVGSDAPTVGIAGATIALSGYEPYTATTNATGNFTITGVFASQTYNFTANATGYAAASGTVVVGTTNVNMPNIIVIEMSFPPHSVVATEAANFSNVALTWQAPNPGAVGITEGFEGATFPPTDWTQVITDTGAATLGVLPTWCQAGSIALDPVVAPHGGAYQAAMWWSYSHQDEWLKTPQFTCPPAATMNFWSYVFFGSTNSDHYYVQVSTDNGANWTILWDATAQTGGQNEYTAPISVDLAAYAGQPIKLALHAEDPPTNDGMWYVWFVDDIQIGSPAGVLKFNADQLSRASQADIKAPVSFVSLPASRALVSNPKLVEPTLTVADNCGERTMLGYKVWRLLAANQANEALWTSLTPTAITPTTYTDNTWAPLPSGVYKYAVKSIYTNDVASAPAFSNQIDKGMMGTLTGTVTEFGTNLPVAGATVTAGEYSGVSNATGVYSFGVYAGTYTVTCAKASYQTATQAGVVIVGLQTTTQNFVMTEITLPAAAVQAVIAGNNVNVTWMAPGTGGGEWIHYDSGENDDSIGTGGAADFDVAVRYPGSALTEYAGMSLYALKVWPAQAGTFSARVWTGGTPTAPGTMVADQAFTPAPLDAWNTVTLTNPVAITGSEELWFGYRCNVTTGYPAGVDAGPGTEGFGNMMYYEGAWSTLMTLASIDGNWNIQGYVGYSAPTAAPELTTIDGTLFAKTAFPTEVSYDRALTGYKVWRLMQGQETNESAWTSLTTNAITATAYQDAGWGPLPDGTYKWAVKAVYTAGALSIPALSNPQTKQTQIGTIAGIVRNMQNQAVSGATVMTGEISATTNASGAYSMTVGQGTHSVTASHPSYNPVTQTGVIVVTGQTTTVNFQLPASENLFVDGFETYPNFALTFAPWTLVDVDMSATYGMDGITYENAYAPMAYIIFNPSATVPPVTDMATHGGAKMAACIAATTPPNNDWMITGQYTGVTQFKFWAKSYSAQYLESFKVGVSTTGTAPANFTIVSGATAIQAPTTWTEYTYDLPTYSAVPIRIGIQCVSNDKFFFLVDDVTIRGASANEDPIVPVVVTELQNNFPNPFNPETTIAYSVKDASPVSIQIYNVKGQLVKTLENSVKEAGNHTVVWNGKDSNGRAVSSGVYYYKMNAGKYSSTKKMIMMK